MALSLEESDKLVDAVTLAPRVTLQDIKEAVAARYDLNAYDAVAMSSSLPAVDELKILSICLLVMRNGFVAVGKSAPASPANFRADIGRTLAYEDAVRQIWPLMGYALREKFYEQTFAEVEG